MTAPSRWTAILGLVSVLALALVLRLVFFVGFQGTDDVATWQMATEISRGHLRPEHVMQNPIATMRYGPALPTALVFLLLGNSEHTLMVYPILVSLAATAAIWDIARRMTGSLVAAQLAGTVMAVASLDIYYSTVALPDAPMSAVSWLSIWAAVVAAGPDRSARSARWWYLASGLLAAFAMMHKEAAVQVALGLGLWGLLQIINRSFRWPMALIAAGFLAGVVAEHAIFLVAWGDPLARWRTVADTAADAEASYAAAQTRPLSYGARLMELASLLPERWPSTTLLAATAVALAAFLIVRFRREPLVGLVSAYVLSVAVMRLLEISHTFSYQPRRFLPLAGGAGLLLACALWRLVPRAWWRAGIIAAFLALQVGLLVRTDIDRAVSDSQRLHAERWLHGWMNEHADLVRARGLYMDERTRKIEEALGGFPDTAAMGLRLFAGPPGEAHAYYGARPPRYEDGGFFFENVRYLDWLLPYNHDASAFDIVRALPGAWRLQAIVVHPRNSAYNAALYEVAAAGEAPPDATTWDWRFDGLGDHARLARGGAGGAPPVTLEIDPGGGQVSAIGTAGPGAGTAILCAAGTGLALTWPIAADALAAGAWIDARLRVRGIDPRGHAFELYARNYRLYYPTQELRAYMAPARDLAGLRVQLDLRTAGRVDLATPQLRSYPHLPFGSSTR